VVKANRGACSLLADIALLGQACEVVVSQPSITAAHWHHIPLCVVESILDDLAADRHHGLRETIDAEVRRFEASLSPDRATTRAAARNARLR
jgi:hypothetical protein